MANKYEELYLEHNNAFYIKDKTVTFSFLNKNKRGLINKITKIVNQIPYDDQKKTEFLTYFNKPNIDNIRKLEARGLIMKNAFLHLCKIRKVTKEENVNSEFPFNSFRCTCPNHLEVGYCLHIIGIMIKLKFISGKTFKMKKKRGPKPKIGSALQREELE